MLERPLNITSASPRQDLDELAVRIRAALQASRQERCNALHHDLDIGDMLIEAQAQVTTGWKRWLRENCFLMSVRTAPALPAARPPSRRDRGRDRARGRAESSGGGPAHCKARREKEPKPKSDLMVAWNKASHRRADSPSSTRSPWWAFSVSSRLRSAASLKAGCGEKNPRPSPSLTTSSPWRSAPPSGA